MAPGVRVRRLTRWFSLRAAVGPATPNAGVNIPKNHLAKLPNP